MSSWKSNFVSENKSKTTFTMFLWLLIHEKIKKTPSWGLDNLFTRSVANFPKRPIGTCNFPFGEVIRTPAPSSVHSQMQFTILRRGSNMNVHYYCNLCKLDKMIVCELFHTFRHMALKQRRINVYATPWRRIDVITTFIWGRVLAGQHLIFFTDVFNNANSE